VTAAAKVGRYRVLRELGRGSMGVVYAADDPVLGRRVALKTIHQDLGDEAYQKRFFAEARAAASLSHPGIVVVYDIGKDPATRQLFMALEYLEIDDAEVSGAHAAIECRGEQVSLRDLASTNGTWIGERRVVHADLEDGSEFRIGKTRFMLTASLVEQD